MSVRPVAEIEACRAGHRSLLADLEPLTDDDLRAASRLPGYSRAHVVTHIANKARTHRALFEAASAGEVRRLHPDGYDADAAAAAGSDRTADELRTDLEQSLLALEAAWDTFGDDHWARQGIMMAGPRTMTEVVGHHLRNIEVHHVDLDIGYEPADWPEAFLDGELARRLSSLSDRANRPDLLLWLLDRGPAPELDPW